MREELEALGLTATEAKVYLALLQIGPSTATVIAKKAAIHRRSAYDTTSRLAEKGLIGYIIQNNRRYFEAVDPERLKDMLQEKEVHLAKILPQLKSQYHAAIEKQSTLVFTGKNGLKTIFEDQIATKEEILILGASPLATEMMRFYMHWFNKRREGARIPVRLIYTTGERKERNLKYAKVRYLPKEFKSPAAMNIYGSKIAIIHWSKERPFAVLIYEKEIAEGYRNYFEFLWKKARP